MKNSDNQLILSTADYNLLTSLFNTWGGRTIIDRKNSEDLKAELKKAKLVSNHDFPPDVVRLNSKVIIKAEGKRKQWN